MRLPDEPELPKTPRIRGKEKKNGQKYGTVRGELYDEGGSARGNNDRITDGDVEVMHVGINVEVDS